jgi:primosomal protein N' (replication factor Y)
MGAAGRIARVLLDSSLPQLDRLLDYRVPDELAETAVPGVRVKVPLRTAGRIAQGYLIELTDDGDFTGSLSELDSVVSAVPVLTPQVFALARRVADRGAGTASDVLRLGIPPRQVRIEKSWQAATAAAASADQPDEAADLHRADVRLEPIAGYPAGRIETAVAKAERIALRAIPRLTELDGGRWVGQWAITLAHAAVHALAAAGSAIIVVPDYRDQEQVEAALAVLAPRDSVVRLDARQANADRYRSFLRCLEDEPCIIVGNRSAVYAPAERLSLIAVWDDGDPLHTEPLSPYANARDVALIRQEQQGSALILAGHTRSVETQRLVEIGWLTDCRPDPTVTPRVVVTTHQASNDGPAAAARIPSAAWRAATDALVSGPVLVQVARPGYAPVVACARCRQVARCARCDGPLGVDRAGATPSCRMCGAIAVDWVCPNCEGTALSLVTRGAGRTAEELGRAFPGTRVIVADGDHPVLAVGSEPAVVVATRGAEPIAAGGYRAVLLLDGERMLLRENLRVGDDCLRWWSNAAALAAHGAPVILVGVGGPLGTAMATWRQDSYAVAELADRRELRFPPAVRIASVVGRPDAVSAAIASIDPSAIIDALGPVSVGDASAGSDGRTVRQVVRFDYAHGATVAAALKAAIVRNASSRRASPRGGGRYRPAPTLKVRFDDPEIL